MGITGRNRRCAAMLRRHHCVDNPSTSPRIACRNREANMRSRVPIHAQVVATHHASRPPSPYGRHFPHGCPQTGPVIHRQRRVIHILRGSCDFSAALNRCSDRIVGQSAAPSRHPERRPQPQSRGLVPIRPAASPQHTVTLRTEGSLVGGASAWEENDVLPGRCFVPQHGEGGEGGRDGRSEPIPMRGRPS